MKKIFLFTGFAVALSLSAVAQKNADAVKFSESINKKRGYDHLSILASDEYEGRETGKKGAWMAAEYIKKQFQSFGLKGPVKDSADPYFQKLGYASLSLSKSVFSVNGQAKESLKDYYITPASVSSTGYDVKASSILFAGYGLNKEGFNEYEGQDVAGKVVMIFATGDPTATAPAPQTGGRRAMSSVGSQQAKIKYLLDNKAAGVLVINANVDNMDPRLKNALQNGNPYLKTADRIKNMSSAQGLPVVVIGTAVANQLLATVNTNLDDIKKKITDSKKPATVVINVPVAFSAKSVETDVRAENVLGFLEGSDPKLKNEILVLTSHYDHIGLVADPNAKDKVNNGADDDGSGTTGVLLMAEAFAKAKKAGKGPKRSILFMTVVGEEKGLLGSEWYSEHPVFPVENTIADLNTDMIGRIGEEYLGKPDSANYVYSVGSFKLSTELGKLSEQMNDTYTKMKLDYKYDDPKDTQQIYYRSDHYNFAKLGIPVIFFYDGMLEQDYHRPGDEVNKINFDLLAKRAHLTFYTAWELANRANRPVVDKNADGTPKTK
ncbi:M28 family peptidase [Pedobacter frigiditerrae]|uniref:M28 family peptidase n=1 Tax=Pedobacter frigiditerrae TaxID=2530452 RepID=A0A4R0N355_9SPHI|nr:M28 family peptidase [Pedobacter frigiditerrae]TCC94271.1 M28 family peptidase [Pedobacter frigiditerrae]